MIYDHEERRGLLNWGAGEEMLTDLIENEQKK